MARSAVLGGERARWRRGAAAALACLAPLAAGRVAVAGEAGDPAVRLPAAGILRHMQALGDDGMEGRGTGARGGALAAAYIEARLAELALEPAGAAGSFRQTVPMHGSLPLESSRLTVTGADGSARTLSLWDDYVLLNSGAETFVPQPSPLVFAGYGIVAPEYDHNDYQDIEVSGRIAVFLAGEPPSSDPDFFEAELASLHSDPEMKFRTALSRGARGGVLIPSPREGAFVDWVEVLDDYQTEDVTLPYGVVGNLKVLLRLEQAARLFDGAAVSLDEVLALDSTGALDSFELVTRVAFEGDFRERDFAADNLLARLPGSDPLLRDDHVIVSAHYDALGIGRPRRGDAVYNGVIDNASGTAVVLELARVLSGPGRRPRRSILFLFLTGEEKGLLGSRYYRDHPARPLHRTVAAVNVDGISFLDPTGDFVGIGSAYSTLGEILEQSLESLGLERAEIPRAELEREPFYASDQLAFAQAGIPAILVMEGFGFRNLPAGEGRRRFIAWSRDRYHTPFDDLAQPISPAALEQHAAVLETLVRAIADTSSEPRWLPGAPWIGERLRGLAEGR